MRWNKILQLNLINFLREKFSQKLITQLYFDYNIHKKDLYCRICIFV